MTTYDSNKLTHELNCIVLLVLKLSLPKYNINNTGFIGLEVCIVGKWAL